MPTPPLLDIRVLADGAAINVGAYRGIRMTLLPGAGATVSYSRVDSEHETAHEGTPTDVTEATVVEVDWPFYYVSVAGGTARVALV